MIRPRLRAYEIVNTGLLNPIPQRAEIEVVFSTNLIAHSMVYDMPWILENIEEEIGKCIDNIDKIVKENAKKTRWKIEGE